MWVGCGLEATICKILADSECPDWWDIVENLTFRFYCVYTVHVKYNILLCGAHIHIRNIHKINSINDIVRFLPQALKVKLLQSSNKTTRQREKRALRNSEQGAYVYYTLFLDFPHSEQEKVCFNYCTVGEYFVLSLQRKADYEQIICWFVKWLFNFIHSLSDSQTLALSSLQSKFFN